MPDGVDALVGFARRLREAGLPVGTERVVAFCRAAAELGDGPADLYWAGRVTLVARHEDLQAYDRLFVSHLAGDEPPPRRATPATRRELGLAVAERETAPAGEGGGGSVVGTVAGRTEVLRHRAFDRQTPEEREATARLVARLGVHAPRRLSRRTSPARRGVRPDMARTLRRSMRSYGEPIDRRWRRRRRMPRRLVLLFDVSGSMEGYTAPLARFAHAAVRSGSSVEAFAFGTRLTRVTPALRARDPDRALAALGDAVADWHGGTRIGETLQELMTVWGRRAHLRGAVVVICSDGLDRGEPEVLARAMERLARLAHRIVWVNPLAGDPAYEPLARGMTAALPHVDHLLSGHNLASLESLARILSEVSG